MFLKVEYLNLEDESGQHGNNIRYRFKITVNYFKLKFSSKSDKGKLHSLS